MAGKNKISSQGHASVNLSVTPQNKCIKELQLNSLSKNAYIIQCALQSIEVSHLISW